MSNATTNTSANTTFKQTLADFSTNDYVSYKHQSNFGFGFEEFKVDFEQVFDWQTSPKTDKRHWTVDRSSMWNNSKARKLKTKEPIKNTAK